MTQDVRQYVCKSCGLSMDRDIHSANRMVQEGRKLVPQELREFMSLDWLASTDTYSGVSKPTEMKGEAHTL